MESKGRRLRGIDSIDPPRTAAAIECMNVVNVYVVVHRCVASFPKGMLTFVSAVMSIDKVTSFVTSGDMPIPCPRRNRRILQTNQKVPTLGLLNSIFIGYLPTTTTLAESANSSCILCFVWKAVHSKLIFHQTQSCIGGVIAVSREEKRMSETVRCWEWVWGG